MNMKIHDTVSASFAGLLLAASFPDLNLYILGWVCLVPLLAAVEGCRPGMGFLLGWTAGTVFHLGLVYWVVVSMTAYGGLPFVLSCMVLVMLSLFLGLFIAVPVGLSVYVRSRAGWALALTLPFFWTASEYCKSWFMTGFPWENLGYSQYRVLGVIQVADITGVYGISFLMVFANCVAYSALRGIFVARRVPYRLIGLLALMLGATLVYGYTRSAVNEPAGKTKLHAVIIQPNIPQHMKWDPSYLAETMNIYKRLTLEAAAVEPDLIVWPESATPFFYQSERDYQRVVKEIIKKARTYLLFGTPSWRRADGRLHYFNSAFLLSPDGTVAGRYDKVHLVPYGEYVPLKQFFPFIDKLVAGIGDFSPGRLITNLKMPQGLFSVLICYEIIFPDLTRRFVKKGARFIVNITNDAWFGRTSAPEQHLSMAVLRAVENKRYLIRAANTGISAFIDPYGRIYRFSKGFTEAVLPAMILCRDAQTVYTRVGDVFALLCCCAGLCFLLAAKRRREVSGAAIITK